MLFFCFSFNNRCADCDDDETWTCSHPVLLLVCLNVWNIGRTRRIAAFTVINARLKGNGSFFHMQQGRVWSLLRANRQLFNFTPLCRWLVKLTRIEMCWEERSYFINSKLRSQTVIRLTNLLITEIEIELVGRRGMGVGNLCVHSQCWTRL